MAEIKNPYDDPKLIQARKDQEDPWIMYLIVNSDLNMSPGKIAAQVGHAVGMMYGHFAYLSKRPITTWRGNVIHRDQSMEEAKAAANFQSWQNDSFRKIVLKSKKKDWNKIKDKLDCFVVRDAGLTEIDPNSETVIGIWPMKRSDRPNIIKKLQCLK